ncbi:DEAD/DEAH box helicase family protein [bacterium]|nr:DEAD/DEAH box helicase family protein [bacterium]
MIFEKYLCDRLLREFGKRALAQIELPASLTGNLNPKYELRTYQVDAFQRFICYFKKDFQFKEHPTHLLFNMATGSGKTLIMAGLILYLYEQGYRNFLFFVNSTNIIEKTKDNFLNPASIKYLFNHELTISNRRVRISPVENFEGVNPSDVNICFTTIQKLHSDLTTERENAITPEDFRKHKVVLIADEAHHMNVRTKSQREMLESWENTVEGIFNQNGENLLLEFTATHDYDKPAMVKKYRNKVIIRYDLVQFRNDRFSKDVVIVRSDFGPRERILQALILSQYKQEVAAKYRINLKCVILFKAQRTIAQSRENKANFHKLINGLTGSQIDSIRKSDIPIVRRAFRFFDESSISDDQLAERIRQEFHRDFCLSVNDEKEKEQHQILLNSLEDLNNRIRAIFAVQKLSEGWDVLNLFDIVRCYEARDTGRAKIGRTTMSEAQLIGRGARYFPFVLPESDDRFRRKFDGDLEHELRVLEELHYHSINDSRYIAEIRSALIEQGMMDQRELTRELTLKESFKKTQFYRYGIVWLNDRQRKDHKGVQSFADLGVKKRNHKHFIATGHGTETIALDKRNDELLVKDEAAQDIKVGDIERNVVQSALARKPFFTLRSLKRYFPGLTSMEEFVRSSSYLGGLGITFWGNIHSLHENRFEKLAGMLGLLEQIEAEIRANVTEYEGTLDFRRKWVREVFRDKLLKFDAHTPRVQDDPEFERFVSDKDWFAFNTVYGTSEEKALVRMLDRRMKKLQGSFEQIYLLRNEGHFAIYNFADGRPFQPDFVLFLREKGGELLIYQLFIEPKGEHLKEHDRWKETFLREITSAFDGKPITFADKKYRLIGPPFYNKGNENEFIRSLELLLNQAEKSGCKASDDIDTLIG